MKARLGIAGASLLVLSLGHGAAAFTVYGQRWAEGSTVLLQLHLGAPPAALIDGAPTWNTVAQGALASWGQLLNGVTLANTAEPAAPAAIPNEFNDIHWDTTVSGEPFGDAVAITRWLYIVETSTMIEADVVIDSARSWNSYRGDLTRAADGTTLNDFRRVALHEFGHLLGLGHPDDGGQSVRYVMNRLTSSIDDIQTDDVQGLQSIYGVRPLDTLGSGSRLAPGQALTSANSQFRLLYQPDGNLVLHDDVAGGPIWATGTGGGAGYALMQTDGNFVLYDAQGAGIWSTSTGGNPSARLVVQADGNLVVVGAAGEPLWDRNR